ncbi:MAG: hypothetical protein V4724_37320 [Pseudomonadota bacterium]
MQSTLMRQQSLSLSQMEFACESLNRLYQACHWRKIEMYLIPAIRQATEQADQLLDELGRLNQVALGVIRKVQEHIADARDDEQQVTEICSGIDNFCESLLCRLDKEEKELFSVARSTIGGDAWFDIANQFLLHDAHVAEARRGRHSERLTLAADNGVVPDHLVLPQLAALPVALAGDEDDAIEIVPPEMQRRHRWPPSRAMAK